MDEVPNDPITNLTSSIVQLHELFVSLVDGGFTEKQALYILGVMMSRGDA